jgi:DNA-binding NarL/FixJ family response regulator
MTQPADPRSVVIIDDEPALRQAVRWLLRADGFEVCGESGNGADGVELAAALQPSFVIVDNMMPRMDGATTAKLIRERVPGAKIVAFSGVVEETPPWADAHLRKDRIAEMGQLLERLVG